MAQNPSDAREASSRDRQAAARVPASQARANQTRANQLPSRDLLSRAANPFGLMRRLSEDMDQFFGQLVGGSATSGWPLLFAQTADWIPAMEVFQRGGNLVIQADLPGVPADDVSVEVADGLLTISGERREAREIDDDGMRGTERRYGRFVRSIAIPEEVRAEDIKASFRDGVLEITVPLPKSAQQRHTVDVQTASSGEAAAASGDGKTGKAAERTQ